MGAVLVGLPGLVPQRRLPEQTAACLVGAVLTPCSHLFGPAHIPHTPLAPGRQANLTDLGQERVWGQGRSWGTKLSWGQD